jgi:hypothetical protein
MPIRHRMGGLDDKLIASLRADGMLEVENETASRERLLEAQYGAENLRHVLNPRYIRDREGKQFKIVQQLDGIHIDPSLQGHQLWPMDPDIEEKESDMVNNLRSAVTNSERERNKYLTNDQARTRTTRERNKQ